MSMLHTISKLHKNLIDHYDYEGSGGGGVVVVVVDEILVELTVNVVVEQHYLLHSWQQVSAAVLLLYNIINSGRLSC